MLLDSTSATMTASARTRQRPSGTARCLSAAPSGKWPYPLHDQALQQAATVCPPKKWAKNEQIRPRSPKFRNPEPHAASAPRGHVKPQDPTNCLVTGTTMSRAQRAERYREEIEEPKGEPVHLHPWSHSPRPRTRAPKTPLPTLAVGCPRPRLATTTSVVAPAIVHTPVSIRRRGA